MTVLGVRRPSIGGNNDDVSDGDVLGVHELSGSLELADMRTHTCNVFEKMPQTEKCL